MSDDRDFVPFETRRRRKADPARVAEFAATARKLQQEREAAGDIVIRLLRDTPRNEWPRLAEREELWNSGALEQLSGEATSRHTHDPQEALAISEIATAIAEALPADRYPVIVYAQLRAHAWKDHGQTLADLSRYPEALRAFDRAEEIIEPFGTLAHDRAIVRLARAAALQEIPRYEDTLTLLTECEAIFIEHGDARRHLICGIIKGNLLHRLGRFREARQAYLLLLDHARVARDRESEASLHNNIGHSCVELGDFKAAEEHAASAIAILTELGQPLRVARAELVRGRILVRQGNLDRGIAQLRATRDRFLSHSMIEEAGLCALEIVEALLARGSAAEAEHLATRVINEFTAAHLNARAITALGYLSEAIATRKASAATAANVRHYLDSLRKEPERLFVATT